MNKKKKEKKIHVAMSFRFFSSYWWENNCFFVRKKITFLYPSIW